MLVCAVLQTSKVKHVMDAMVVGKSAHIVPLFNATGERLRCDSSSRLLALPAAGPVLPARPLPPPQPPNSTRAPVAGRKAEKEKKRQDKAAQRKVQLTVG